VPFCSLLGELTSHKRLKGLGLCQFLQAAPKRLPMGCLPMAFLQVIPQRREVEIGLVVVVWHYR
jgi:hypothetical protein